MRLLILLSLLTLSAPTWPTERSAAARAAFVRTHPCPSTGKNRGRCPGYIVDHVQALACGGKDAPENMQWQTVEEAKAKDRWELYCRLQGIRQ